MLVVITERNLESQVYFVVILKVVFLNFFGGCSRFACIEPYEHVMKY